MQSQAVVRSIARQVCEQLIQSEYIFIVHEQLTNTSEQSIHNMSGIWVFILGF